MWSALAPTTSLDSFEQRKGELGFPLEAAFSGNRALGEERSHCVGGCGRSLLTSVGTTFAL